MKLFLLVLLFSIMLNAKAQKTAHCMPVNQIVYIVDSLKQKLIKEIPRYGEELKSTYRNIRGSSPSRIFFASPIFVVNKYYAYRFYAKGDSIKVIDFLNQYFQPQLICRIDAFDPIVGTAIYGIVGNEGLVHIQLKKGIKFNPKIAGLKIYKRGDIREVIIFS